MSRGQVMLGYTGLLDSEERSKQIRGSQLFKMLVMLLFHFHELCFDSQAPACQFHRESERTTKLTALHLYCKGL